MSEIKTIKYSQDELNEAIAIVGFPTVGLVGSIVCNYIIKELKMPVLMGMSSDDMSPYCVLIDEKPYPPIRVHGFRRGQKNKLECGDLMIVTSEVTPNIKQCYNLSNEMLSMFKDYGIKKVICIEGIPRFGEDDDMYACSSTSEARDMIKFFEVKSLDNGIIKGLTGVMLFEGRERDIDIVTLLCPADQNLPDPRTAVKVVEKLAKVVPELNDIDTAPLEKEAVNLEKRILADIEKGTEATNEPLPYDRHIYG